MYKRVLLKLSGEVFKGDLESGIDANVVMGFAKRLKKLQKKGLEIGIVIGGGNIWRYRDTKEMKLDRVVSDTIGMMATVMNAVALGDALREVGAKVKVVSSFPCDKAVERHVPMTSRGYMENGDIVIFAGGTGSPFFTTDSAAALRALEMKCDVLMKATKVDYVYDKDPTKFKDAKKYTKLTYQEVIESGLEVMDLTCASLCKQGNIPMLVFNLNAKDSIEKAVSRTKIGTLIK